MSRLATTTIDIARTGLKSKTEATMSNVINFPAKPTFAAATKTWLKVTQAHPLLTEGCKRLCVGLYCNFNYKHYEATGELLAWPSWNRLIAEFGLCKATINDGLCQLEHFSLLEIKRGGYASSNVEIITIQQNTWEAAQHRKMRQALTAASS